MRRSTWVLALVLAFPLSACGKAGPTNAQTNLIERFHSSLNQRDFAAIYSLHDQKYRASTSLAEVSGRYAKFREWAGRFRSATSVILGEQSSGDRHWPVVRVEALYDCGIVVEEFVFDGDASAPTLGAFRWNYPRK
jgi:hypothetical protein